MDMHVGFQRVWDKRESVNNCGEHEEQTLSVCGYAQTGTLTIETVAVKSALQL